MRLPAKGAAFLSVHDRDKPDLLPVARRLAELGFDLLATWGTAEYLQERGLKVRAVNKVHEARPHVVDHLINGDIHLIVNTPMGRESFEDDSHIRTTALRLDIPCITTLSGATAAVEGIAAQRAQAGFDVRSLQSLGGPAAAQAAAADSTTARAS